MATSEPCSGHHHQKCDDVECDCTCHRGEDPSDAFWLLVIVVLIVWLIIFGVFGLSEAR